MTKTEQSATLLKIDDLIFKRSLTDDIILQMYLAYIDFLMKFLIGDQNTIHCKVAPSINVNDCLNTKSI